ncbi:MAG: TonB-dependent receptor, partial [Saprospiraceae bacterium]|nr:TonB-dependent receptor [Saprospiraceae bacterium]
FHVRGGNIDQNLIMIDEGILFNPSHALGFFSSFNSDILSDALLFKGNVPAKYGGRLASVLDLNVRDGNFEKIRMKGGVGPVSTRFTIEGPLVENKTSALFAVRSSYSDWVLRQVNIPEVRQSSVFFYDANLRISHRFNDNHNISLAAYSAQDRFTYADEFGFDYNTLMAQGTYRKVFGERVLSTFSAIWSRYESEQNDLAGSDASQLQISNEYLKLKENISYNGSAFSSDLGVSAIFYKIEPGKITPDGLLSTVISGDLPQEEGLESAIYANAEVELSSRLSISGGLRLSLYQFFGPREMFTYSDPEFPTVGNLLEKTTFDKNVIHSENQIEPRLSARYRFDASSSAKLGYARTSQYLNQISNNETPTPTSLWQLTNQYIPPHFAHNFTLGYFRNFDENLWITSLEVFYRDIDQLFDYRDFADLIVNDHLETELVHGTGRAYGVELGIKKQVGKISGWLNYTYSKSERKISEINDGDWYPANFDKPHDVSIVTNLHINKRNQISINFNYSTGRPITIPVDRHVLEGRFGVLNYSTRNAFRIPDYHRLDISYTLGQGFRKSKKFKTSWTFSVYNLYGRRNAFSVFLVQQTRGEPEIRRLSVLGSAFPSLTFNFELL